MTNPKLSILIPIISTCLLAGGTSGIESSQKASFGFPGSDVNIVYSNPDTTTWKPFDPGDKPRPDNLNVYLMHTGIIDSKGVNIQPVIRIAAWKFPWDGMTLERFADILLKNFPATILNKTKQSDRIFIDGAVFYGGNTHIIKRAFIFQNRVGIDIVCDSTEGVYPKVEESFNSVLRQTQLSPRIAPVPIQLPPITDPQKDKEVVTIRKQFLEKQPQGGPLNGNVAGIKDSDGMVVFWNRSAPYFKVKVEGEKFAGYGTDRAVFSVDKAMLQIQSTKLTDFCPDGQLKNPEAILEAHRNWEFRYIEGLAGCACSLRSWSGNLADGTPILYWDVTPQEVPKDGVIRHLFCTRFNNGSVIGCYSAEDKDISLAQAKNLVFYAIAHIEFSNEKFDIEKIQKQMAAAHP